jgi:hypothetical protein
VLLVFTTHNQVDSSRAQERAAARQARSGPALTAQTDAEMADAPAAAAPAAGTVVKYLTSKRLVNLEVRAA